MPFSYDIQNDYVVSSGFVELGNTSSLATKMKASQDNIITVSNRLIEDNVSSRMFFISNSGNLTAKGFYETSVDPNVTAWVERVVANGGAAPSRNTIDAATTFLADLKAAGLRSKMLHVNIIAPDNVSASFTPLIVDYGFTKWTRVAASGASTVSVNGLSCPVLNTGFNPSVAFPNDNSAGITSYKFTQTVSYAEAGCETADVGAGGIQFWIANGQGNDAGISMCFNLTSRCWSYDWHTNHGGYFSGNRTAANAHIFYAANNSIPHAGYSNKTGASGARPNLNCYFAGLNENDTGTRYGDSNYRSFLAFHYGLTAGESLSFYNAIVALRTKLGGGLV